MACNTTMMVIYHSYPSWGALFCWVQACEYVVQRYEHFMVCLNFSSFSTVLINKFHRKSFTNCACTYEVALSGPDCLPINWPFKAVLKGDHVQDGFIILSLLNECHECNTALIVPHTGEQVNHFTEAIKAWNSHIKLYGQQEVIHHCKKCTWVYKDQDGQYKFMLNIFNGKLISTF